MHEGGCTLIQIAVTAYVLNNETFPADEARCKINALTHKNSNILTIPQML